MTKWMADQDVYLGNPNLKKANTTTEFTTKGKIPRHAKKYRDFQQEFTRLQKERESAFQEFYDDVHTGAFPEKKNIVEINENELDIFLNKLEKRG